MSQFVDFHRFEEVRIYCASADYLTGQQIKKPFLCGAVFGKDDDALVIPLTTGLQGSFNPVDQRLCLAIRSLRALGG